MKRASYSALDLYDKCPALYQARRVDKMVELRSKPLAVGVAAHAVIEDYLHHLAERNVISDRAIVGKLVRDYFADTNADIVATQYMDDVAYIVRQVAEQFVYIPDASLGVEEWIEAPLNLDGQTEIQVVGRLDLVYLDEKAEGQPIVGRDWKTGWATSEAAYELQQLICGWLLNHRYGGEHPLAFEFDFPRVGYVSPRHRFTPFDFVKAEDRMRTIIKRILSSEAKNEWPEQPGDHCSFCPIAVTCATRRGLTETAQDVSDDDSAKLALLDCAVLEAALKRRKEALKRWTDSNGPVEAEGLFAGKVAAVSNGVRDVKRLVDTIGLVDAIPYLTVNNKAKGIKKDDRLADLREQIVGNPRFKVGKKKADALDDDEDAA